MTSPPTLTGVIHIEIRKGAYADSVALLQVSKDVAASPGVLAAQVAMATPLNLGLLEQMGFAIPESSTNDMVVALRVESDEQIPAALRAVETALAATSQRAGGAEEVMPPRTTTAAMTRIDTSIALVSVPGEYAAMEAFVRWRF